MMVNYSSYESYESYESYGNYDTHTTKTIRLYTLEDVEKIINKRNKIAANKKFRLAIYFLKQKLCALLMIGIGVVCPMIDGDATASLVVIPLGIGLLVTKSRVMDFKL